MKITNDQGLLVCEDGTCLGYLFNFNGHGVFSPDGKVEITPEQAETHNRVLAQAEIKGLDENCEIGQCGTFYYVNGKVSTFTGEVVSTSVLRKGKSLTFYRNGKAYRGILRKDADCFNFKRVS